jgi:glycosyltransferase involved in cell wall biosynthesis
MSGQLKVAIAAPITPGTSGGVATFIMGLVRALGRLHDGPEIYTIVVESQQQLDCLKPHSGANQQLVLKTSLPNQDKRMRANGRITFPGLLKCALGPLLPAAKYIQRLICTPAPRYWPEVPISDGFYESLGCDVVHNPTQNFVLYALPTIYNPHDLQHLHYPQFFNHATIAWRETIYPAGCRLAHTVVVGSQWAKDDVVRQYGVSPEKVQVIPEGPATQSYPEPSPEFLVKVKYKYQLEEPFVVYPAVTWPHKNHIRLLEALAYLRDNCGLTVRLVCTGSLYQDFWNQIENCIDQLKLRPQVKFLGFVPGEDLRAIYRLSQCLVEPTLFEACSLPIFEAWLEGVPVACSNATALPEQVKNAALLFEPRDVQSVANAIREIATDSELRRELRSRGYQRLEDFDWERTAKAYRAVYRRAAGFPLTEEDCWLLKWNWMTEPQREMESRS